MKNLLKYLVLSVSAFALVQASSEETEIVRTESLLGIAKYSDRTLAEELIEQIYNDCSELIPLYADPQLKAENNVKLHISKPRIEQDLQRLSKLIGEPLQGFNPDARAVVSQYLKDAKISLNGHLQFNYQQRAPLPQQSQKITMFQRPYRGYIEDFCQSVLTLRKINDPECVWSERIKELVKKRASRKASNYSKALIKKYGSFDRFDYKLRVSQESYHDMKDLLLEFQNGTVAPELPYDSSRDRPSIFGGFVQSTGNTALAKKNGFDSYSRMDSVLMKFRANTKVTDDERLILVALRGRDFEYQYVEDIEGMHLFSIPSIQKRSRNGKTVNPRILLLNTGKSYVTGDKIDFEYLSIDQFFDLDGEGDLIPVFYGESIQQ